MTSEIYPDIKGGVPEYLQTQYPIFVDFLNVYYQYLNSRENAGGEIVFRKLNADIDTTLDKYIDEFYLTYGKQLPKTLRTDRRNFIKLLNSIYNAKGTEDALRLMFHGVFGETIEVSYPSQNILRASDGKWVQERFFEVITEFGELPHEPFYIDFFNSVGEYRLLIQRTVQVSLGKYRCFFDEKIPVTVSENQLISTTNVSGELLWVGKIVQTPANLRILNPGADWQRGQVIVIPGEVSNTIARVSNVSLNGEIQNIEILEHGIGHQINQHTVVSPYPAEPPSTTAVIDRELVAVSPLKYHYTLNINDYTNGIQESVYGVQTGLSTESYFLEEYVESSYSGNVAFRTDTFFSSEQTLENVNPDLTYEEWLASRATLIYDPANIVKTRGDWSNSDGQISNQEIRLQDNYFYQAFSYLISSTKQIKEFGSVVKQLHPAGTKMFGELIKQFTHNIVVSSQRTIQNDVIYLTDDAPSFDIAKIHFSKAVFDSVENTDIHKLVFGKILADSISTSDSEIFTFTKSLLDSFSTTETISKDSIKSLLDSFSTTETISKDNIKSLLDSFSIIDSVQISLNKSFGDSVSVADSESYLTEFSQWSEDYTLEKYATTEITIEIG